MLNGIRCDKLFTAVATVKAHPDKYEKYFDAAITFLIQYIGKQGPTLSVLILSMNQTKSASSRRPAPPMALSNERLS